MFVVKRNIEVEVSRPGYEERGLEMAESKM
jgi:hypothetical protein